MKAGLVAGAALLVCCAVPALFAIGGGFLAAAGGVAIRLWPVTVMGLALTGWGCVRLVRLVSRKLAPGSGAIEDT